MTESEREKEVRIFKMRMEDLAHKADRSGCPVCSDFLNERQCEMLEHWEAGLPVSVFYSGGYEGAERKVAVFCPFFWASEKENEKVEKLLESHLQLLEIRLVGQKFAKRNLTHRDYLGALLGNGIVREKVGDIVINENGAWAWVKKEVGEYIAKSTLTVSYVKCEISQIEKMPETWQPTIKEVVVSVSSMRLDGVVGRGFNLSRGDAAYLIRTGKVFINGITIQEPDRKVHVGDSITLRGKGKFKISEEKGNSRSGRMQLLLQIGK